MSDNKLRNARFAVWLDSVDEARSQVALVDNQILAAENELLVLRERRVRLSRYLDYSVLEALAEDDRRDPLVTKKLLDHKPDNNWL